MGGCYVNKRRVRISSKIVKAGDTILLEQSSKPVSQVSLTNADIVFQCDSLIAINKPAGMPSQPTRSQAKYHVEESLKKLLEPKQKAELVHRLDQETTGLMILSLSKEAKSLLMEMFKHRHVLKTYLLLCHGLPKWSSLVHENKLSRIHPATGVVKPHPEGKPAKTKFTVIAKNKEARISLVKAMPTTGRTHQIRVHAAELGIPILGDKKYLSKRIRIPEEITPLLSHHMLHAYSLELKHEDLTKIGTLKAPLPADFMKICQILGFQAPPR